MKPEPVADYLRNMETLYLRDRVAAWHLLERIAEAVADGASKGEVMQIAAEAFAKLPTLQ